MLRQHTYIWYCALFRSMSAEPRSPDHWSHPMSPAQSKHMALVCSSFWPDMVTHAHLEIITEPFKVKSSNVPRNYWLLFGAECLGASSAIWSCLHLINSRYRLVNSKQKLPLSKACCVEADSLFRKCSRPFAFDLIDRISTEYIHQYYYTKFFIQSKCNLSEIETYYY